MIRCRNHEQDCDGVLQEQFIDHYICPKCRMGFVLQPVRHPEPKGQYQ